MPLHSSSPSLPLLHTGTKQTNKLSKSFFYFVHMVKAFPTAAKFLLTSFLRYLCPDSPRRWVLLFPFRYQGFLGEALVYSVV